MEFFLDLANTMYHHRHFASAFLLTIECFRDRVLVTLDVLPDVVNPLHLSRHVRFEIADSLGIGLIGHGKKPPGSTLHREVWDLLDGQLGTDATGQGHWNTEKRFALQSTNSQFSNLLEKISPEGAAEFHQSDSVPHGKFQRTWRTTVCLSEVVYQVRDPIEDLFTTEASGFLRYFGNESVRPLLKQIAPDSANPTARLPPILQVFPRKRGRDKASPVLEREHQPSDWLVSFLFQIPLSRDVRRPGS